MFKQQHTLLESIPSLRSILHNYSWQSSPENWIELAENDARDFIVTVPFVGAFSAGKSTLINALMEDKLLSTNIDPETAYPAEISHGKTEQVSGRFPDNQEIVLTRSDLTSLSDRLPKGSHVSVKLPHPLLARLHHLRLVDMPGWESGIEAHSDAIDNYAARSLAYCVVVSAEEGSLRESLRRALRELAARDMPVLAIISKADKKPIEDVDAVAEQVRQEIEATTGRPPFAVVTTSARQNRLGELITALENLEREAETIFRLRVGNPVLEKLASFDIHLNTLINSDDLNSEEIRAKYDQLNAEMSDFENLLRDETAQLEVRLQPALSRIMERVRNALIRDIPSIADELMDGGDLAGSLGSIARLAVKEGVDSDVTPELSRYLGRIEDALPPDFLPEVTCSFEYKHTSGEVSSRPLATPILLALQPLLVDPRLKVIAAAITTIASVLESFFRDRKQEAIERARKLESIKGTLMQKAIPDVIRQVKDVLQPTLESYVETARNKIEAAVGAQQKSYSKALDELASKLSEGQAAFEKTREKYLADQEAVRSIAAQLKDAGQP